MSYKKISQYYKMEIMNQGINTSRCYL